MEKAWKSIQTASKTLNNYGKALRSNEKRLKSMDKHWIAWTNIEKTLPSIENT